MNILKPASIGIAAATIMLAACTTGKTASETISGLNPERFDSIINNKKTALYTLKNSNGMEVCITNFGGRVVSLVVPDAEGKPTDVVLGYDNLRQYADSVNSPSDFGSTVGRYANRIADGKLTIDGKTYQLPRNNFGHCLHGGPSGWQYQVYDAAQPNDTTLVLTIVSPDGDNNFPGTVTAHATYRVLSNNTLDISFDATTDKPTVVNMTNHSYFNLNGDPSKEGVNQWLYVNADSFTPANSTYMTTGEIRSVANTPMDFRRPHAIAETIGRADYDQISNATGYDHNWCLNTYKDGKGNDNRVCAVLWSPETKIGLSMYTNEPGVQVYTANFQGTGISCKHGVKYPKHASVCLESQKYPDSPNKHNWPSPILRPGEKYHSHVAYRFWTGDFNIDK